MHLINRGMPNNYKILKERIFENDVRKLILLVVDICIIMGDTRLGI